MRRTIVLSGVNLTEMGPLAVFHDAIATLAEKYANSYNIIALVHKKSLFNIPNVTFIEYPRIKTSWLRRLCFEYYDCRALSARISPYLWFAMHDISPSVKARIRAVYCHNPAPFYSLKLRELLFDWKFSLFVFFYRFLYRINIKSNNYVVVQQDWLRTEFKLRYKISSVIVAHPSIDHGLLPKSTDHREVSTVYRFFYPAFPRTFKNIELVLDAASRLEDRGFHSFELWLTIDGTETPYAANLVKKYSGLKTVRWLGLLTRSEVIERYAEADCLLFPSKLETWGMPITEFKSTGKPLLVANLPYARETVGEYKRSAFFNPGDAVELASMMRQAVAGEGSLFKPSKGQFIAQPFSENWQELWDILLPI